MNSRETIENIRKRLSVFVQFTDEEVAYFAQFVEFRNFDKKKQIVNIGDTDSYYNYVVKGLVRKYFYKGKEEIVTQIAKENEIITATVTYEEQKPSTYILETIEPTIFASIRKYKLVKLFEESHKMEHLGRMLITNIYQQKENWEYDRIRLNTRERFVQFIQNNSDLFQRVPQKYLASYLNIKPETFSRMKHLLQKRK